MILGAGNQTIYSFVSRLVALSLVCSACTLDANFSGGGTGATQSQGNISQGLPSSTSIVIDADDTISFTQRVHESSLRVNTIPLETTIPRFTSTPNFQAVFGVEGAAPMPAEDDIATEVETGALSTSSEDSVSVDVLTSESTLTALAPFDFINLFGPDTVQSLTLNPGVPTGTLVLVNANGVQSNSIRIESTRGVYRNINSQGLDDLHDRRAHFFGAQDSEGADSLFFTAIDPTTGYSKLIRQNESRYDVVIDHFNNDDESFEDFNYLNTNTVMATLGSTSGMGWVAFDPTQVNTGPNPAFVYQAWPLHVSVASTVDRIIQTVVVTPQSGLTAPQVFALLEMTDAKREIWRFNQNPAAVIQKFHNSDLSPDSNSEVTKLLVRGEDLCVLASPSSPNQNLYCIPAGADVILSPAPIFNREVTIVTRAEEAEIYPNDSERRVFIAGRTLASTETTLVMADGFQERVVSTDLIDVENLRLINHKGALLLLFNARNTSVGGGSRLHIFEPDNGSEGKLSVLTSIPESSRLVEATSFNGVVYAVVGTPNTKLFNINIGTGEAVQVMDVLGPSENDFPVFTQGKFLNPSGEELCMQVKSETASQKIFCLSAVLPGQ